MEKFVAVTREDFEDFEMGKCAGFLGDTLMLSFHPKNMPAYVNGFISGVSERIYSRRLPQVILQQSCRTYVPQFWGTVFPVISSTNDKYYVLVNFFTEMRAVWVEKNDCLEL